MDVGCEQIEDGNREGCGKERRGKKRGVLGLGWCGIVRYCHASPYSLQNLRNGDPWRLGMGEGQRYGIVRLLQRTVGASEVTQRRWWRGRSPFGNSERMVDPARGPTPNAGASSDQLTGYRDVVDQWTLAVSG